MDRDRIPRLIQIGGFDESLQRAQGVAAAALREVGVTFPRRAGAATLSALLEAAGINVPMTLGAGKLAQRLGGRLNSRRWDHVPVGEQEAGDVGVCLDDSPRDGADHVYLVVRRVDNDEMVIADNQATTPHPRFASGKGGKTPTDHFLRAPAGPSPVGVPPSIPTTTTPNPVPGIERIIQIAAGSSIARFDWANRGVAPAGYIKGMAVVFARVVCKLAAQHPAAVEMAKPETGDVAHDALAWYRSRFLEAGLHGGDDGADRLRHLFVLMVGLGMRESSGRYCEGRDRSTVNTGSNTAEAGLFQTSFDARGASPLLPPLFTDYAGRTDFLDIFKEGVRARDRDLENFGRGDGREFQRLSKTCPAFAAEFAAITLRNLRKHYGPINTRAAEVRPECDDMLKEVQLATLGNHLCPVLA